MEIDQLTAQLKTLFPDIPWTVEEKKKETPGKCFNASDAHTHDLYSLSDHKACKRLRLDLKAQHVENGEDQFTFENTVYTSKYGGTGHGEDFWKIKGTGTFLESAYVDMIKNMETLLNDYDDILIAIKKLLKKTPPVLIYFPSVVQHESSRRLSIDLNVRHDERLRPRGVKLANQRMLHQFKDAVKLQLAYVRKIQQLSETVYAKNLSEPPSRHYG